MMEREVCCRSNRMSTIVKVSRDDEQKKPPGVNPAAGRNDLQLVQPFME
jgi:hypothetical protein